jgi:3-hydroxybutyryl-CoA dehydrogenase
VDVVVRERDAAAVEAGMTRIFKSLERAAKAGKLSDADMAAAMARLRFTTDIADFADRQMVIEAIAEDQELKTSLFAELDRVVTSPDAIFASNTSSIPIMKLGISTKRPKNVIGLHFFNPVTVLNLVEVVPSLMTSPETIAAAESLDAEFKEPLYAPPPMLARMCEAGLLGRKTGRGFYDYS